MHPLTLIALGGLAVLVLSWLIVSFLSPSPARRRLEWIGATSMYVTLLAFFSRQLHDAVGDDSLVRMFAFGFLVTIFGLGFLISIAKLLAALGGRGADAKPSATH